MFVRYSCGCIGLLPAQFYGSGSELAGRRGKDDEPSIILFACDDDASVPGTGLSWGWRKMNGKPCQFLTDEEATEIHEMLGSLLAAGTAALGIRDLSNGIERCARQLQSQDAQRHKLAVKAAAAEQPKESHDDIDDPE